MANKNRNNQNKNSADHKTIKEKKKEVTRDQSNGGFDASVL